MIDFPIDTPPKRVISLVPSLTETMFDLGFGSSLVGITDYCIYPTDIPTQLLRIGGPRTPDFQKICDLQPDLVLVGQEESTDEVIEILMSKGLPVWIWFPKTVRQVINGLWQLAGLYRSENASKKVRTIEVSYEWAELSVIDKQPLRYFCPVWQEEYSEDITYWVTFNHDTYCNDLLRLFGGSNIFENRIRRYPLEADLGLSKEEELSGRDARYPRVTKQEICSLDPELIILPSEPFSFTLDHRKKIIKWFKGTSAVDNGRIMLVDGTLIAWYGTRLARAISELSLVFEVK